MAEVSSAPVAPEVGKLNGVSGVSYRAFRPPSSVKFDPTKHLCFKPPTRRYSMKELGFEGQGISPVATVEPFPLFTPEAVKAFREDILSTEVLDKYTVSTHLAARQAREFNTKVAPFTYQAWSSPEVTRCVSEALGMEVIPIMPLELGHVNYQCGKGTIEELRALSSEPSAPYPELSEEQKNKLAEENDMFKSKQVVDWHFDSYPIVCVLMLSDASTMLGGETALRCGDGSIKKVRGPLMGYATVLQGRHVEHLACKAYNSYERITMVTSYRAKDPLVRDASVLSTIRCMSQEDRLNYQWTLYRARLLADRFKKFADELEAKREGVEADYFPTVIDKKGMKAFVDEQIDYLNTTWQEMM